jgi:hypothetical protein
MRATKVIYIGKDKKKYVTCLPIIFPTNVTTTYTTVAFDGTTALFSNARVEGTTLIVSGATINNNTLIMEE